jgi:hypothetical protein
VFIGDGSDYGDEGGGFVSDDGDARSDDDDDGDDDDDDDGDDDDDDGDDDDGDDDDGDDGGDDGDGDDDNDGGDDGGDVANDGDGDGGDRDGGDGDDDDDVTALYIDRSVFIKVASGSNYLKNSEKTLTFRLLNTAYTRTPHVRSFTVHCKERKSRKSFQLLVGFSMRYWITDGGPLQKW